MKKNQVRVRFAPSPTGPLHIGGLRTALFNYLFAKKTNGTFILRIEDTDQTRYVEGAEKYILESLKWTNLLPDESVETSGQYGPYRQSERKKIYREYIEQLIHSGHAYYAFDTPEDLEQMRERLKEKGIPNPQYNAEVRLEMNNSFSLSQEETNILLQSGKPYVVRFKMPDAQDIIFKDIVRGEIQVNSSTLDDKVLFKSDGMPTYHLANVVDDYLMQISHVIRGEEWLPSTPLHVMLYKALGWEDAMPEFAHLPLLLKPSGKGKLSKRDGDKLGFPVFPLQWKDPKTGEIASGYRESGYFPEAFINLLAFLGWNPGTEQERFSLEQLTQAFSLERVGKAGARFDPDKAKWFNHHYLQEKSDEFLAGEYQKILQQKGIDAEKEYIARVCSLIKERASFVSEFWEQSAFFFEAPDTFDPKAVKKRWKTHTPDTMKELIKVLEKIEPFSSQNTEEQVKQYIESSGAGMGQVMNALRLAIVGELKGPHLFDITEMLGKEEVIKRIQFAIENIQK